MTKEYQPLTEKQRELIVNHLDLVAQVLNKHICRDLSNPDLDWDDLYQTGCLALCKAALFHNTEKPFGPYAARAIRNALFDYCGKSMRYRKPLCTMEQLPEVPVYDEASLAFYEEDLTTFLKTQGELYYWRCSKKRYPLPSQEGGRVHQHRTFQRIWNLSQFCPCMDELGRKETPAGTGTL